MISQEELKQLICYDPDTGFFIWKKTNKRAGYTRSDGYVAISVKSKIYRAHRLVWLYVYGKFPDDVIDHINRIRNDNRLCNLRECTNQQNQWNRSIHTNNKSGYPGVHWHKKNKKFNARIRINNKRIHLGSFDCPKQAYEAYLKAKSELHKV